MGSIDAPSAGTVLGDEPVRVVGWALAPRPGIGSVELTLGGRGIGPARLGLPRPDVAWVTDHPDAPICRFERWMDPLELPPDPLQENEIEIGAILFDLAGGRHQIPSIRIRSRAPGPPPPWGSKVARPTSPERLHRSGGPMLAVAHTMTRNGAGLYLLEVLTALSRVGITSVVAAPDDGELTDLFQRADIPVHRVASFSFDDPAAHHAAIDQIAEVARALSASFVLAHGSPTIGAVHAGDRLGLPSAYWIGGGFTPREFFATYLGRFPHPDVMRNIVEAFALADRVLFLSEETRRRYVADGIVEDRRTLAVAPPLDLDALTVARTRTEVRRELGVPQEARMVLCVGAMTPLKGQATLVQAFRYAVDEADAYLVLVGDLDDEYSWGIQHYAERNGIAPRCRIVASVDDIGSVYAACDIFSTASDSEGGPRVLMEALALGVPVVTTEVGSVSPKLEAGRSGFLAAPRDTASLAAQLRRALTLPPEKLRAVGEAGRRVASSIGGIPSVIPVYRRMIDELTAGPAG